MTHAVLTAASVKSRDERRHQKGQVLERPETID